MQGDSYDLGTWVLNTLSPIAVWPPAAPGQLECRGGPIPLTKVGLVVRHLPSFAWCLSYDLYSHSPPEPEDRLYSGLLSMQPLVEELAGWQSVSSPSQ